MQTCQGPRSFMNEGERGLVGTVAPTTGVAECEMMSRNTQDGSVNVDSGKPHTLFRSWTRMFQSKSPLQNEQYLSLLTVLSIYSYTGSMKSQLPQLAPVSKNAYGERAPTEKSAL